MINVIFKITFVSFTEDKSVKILTSPWNSALGPLLYQKQVLKHFMLFYILFVFGTYCKIVVPTFWISSSPLCFSNFAVVSCEGGKVFILRLQFRTYLETISSYLETIARAAAVRNFKGIASRVGCPNFTSKKVSLQSETKQNANGFASFSRNSGKKISLHFALFRFVSLKNMFRFKVSLREQFRFVSLKNILPSPPQHLSSYAACRNFL